MSKKVAVVTGSNKGIGLAIVERLYNDLKDKNFDIYLTSRSDENGKKALQELEKKGVKVCYHQLDITCEKSVERLACFLKEKYGGLDILVNNAGIYKEDRPLAEQAEVTLETNFFKTLAFCEAMFPLLRPHARVVNLGSSFAFHMGLDKCSPEMRAKFTSPTCMDNLKAGMQKFVDEAKAGKDVTKCGFPPSSYSLSKLAVTVMGILQQRALDKDPREDLVVNVADPGFVDTGMTSGLGAPLSTADGADTPCYLALLPAGTAIKGQHVAKREIQAWK